MSRTGNCYDNAPMESFFHTLKVELVHQCRWATQAEARQALFGYIEGYYNRHRMHSALGYLTPEQAEQRRPANPACPSGQGKIKALPPGCVSRLKDGEDHGCFGTRWILCLLWQAAIPLAVEAIWLRIHTAPIAAGA